jgi:ligand-binding sensor domain-containing protein
MRLTKGNLRDVPNKAAPAISETFNVKPSQMAQLVDREGNIWFGDTKGIHRFFYTPLIRQEFSKETSERGDFAVVADDHGAVWTSFSSGGADTKGELYRVQDGKAERRLLPVTSSFAYRAPDKTVWFSGERCLWHLVGGDFVRVSLPPQMVNQFELLQTITADRQGGIWVSFGRHGLYRLANGTWTLYGGRGDLPKTGILMFCIHRQPWPGVVRLCEEPAGGFGWRPGPRIWSGRWSSGGQRHSNLWSRTEDLDRR